MHQDNNMCFCTLVQFIKSSKGVCSLISLWFHSSVLPWCKTWTINHVNLFPPIIGPFKCFLALVLPLLVLLQMSWLPIFPLPYASYSLMECHSVFGMLKRKYTLSSKLFSNLNKSCKFTFLIFLDWRYLWYVTSGIYERKKAVAFLKRTDFMRSDVSSGPNSKPRKGSNLFLEHGSAVV